MTQVTLIPVEFDPFAKTSRAFVDANVDPVKPDVQAQRDKVAATIKTREESPDGGGMLPTSSVVAGTPSAAPAQITEFNSSVSAIPNRGTRIAAERAPRRTPDAVFPLAKEQPPVQLIPVESPRDSRAASPAATRR